MKPPPFGLILLLGAFCSLGAMVLDRMPVTAAAPGLALHGESAGVAEPSPQAAETGPTVTQPTPSAGANEPFALVSPATASRPTATPAQASSELQSAGQADPVGRLPSGLVRQAELQPLASLETALLSRMNAARSVESLLPLARDAGLDGVALARARDLVDQGYFDHYAPDGTSAFTELAARGLPYYLAGENLARNNYPPAETVDAAFEGLMASPGHRANIMEPRFGAVGVAAVRTGDVWLYVTVFTNPR